MKIGDGKFEIRNSKFEIRSASASILSIAIGIAIVQIVGNGNGSGIRWGSSGRLRPPHNPRAGEDIVQGSAVCADQDEEMSPLEGHRTHAVRREAKEGACRPDRTVLPVVHDPQAHGPFAGSGAKEAPSDD
jgi:hypothetical protein